MNSSFSLDFLTKLMTLHRSKQPLIKHIHDKVSFLFLLDFCNFPSDKV